MSYGVYMMPTLNGKAVWAKQGDYSYLSEAMKHVGWPDFQGATNVPVRVIDEVTSELLWENGVGWLPNQVRAK